MDRKEIKARAKEFAFKNKWNLWKPSLVIIAISFAFGLVLGFLGINTEEGIGALISAAFDIAILPMSIGYISYVIKLIRGENPDLNTALFQKYNMFVPILLTTLIVGICTLGWTLLLIVPGIIYAYKVIMVNYILADTDSKDVKWSDVIAQSKEMMEGHKWEFFVFELSFFGWILLSVFTLGIALIWTLPYMETALVMYYEELKKLKNPEQPAVEIVQPEPQAQ